MAAIRALPGNLQQANRFRRFGDGHRTPAFGKEAFTLLFSPPYFVQMFRLKTWGVLLLLACWLPLSLWTGGGHPMGGELASEAGAFYRQNSSATDLALQLHELRFSQPLGSLLHLYPVGPAERIGTRVAADIFAERNTGESSTVPPEFSCTWQFSRRAAGLPRAPSKG